MQGERSTGENIGAFAPDDQLHPVIAAAHELKNPLSLIRQLALTLTNEPTLADEHKRLLRQITLTSERSLRTVTGLTRSVRLEDSLFELSPINPQTICEQVVTELQPLYRERGCQLYAKSRGRALLAIGNEELLRRILLNFADNALRFSEADHPVVVRAGTVQKGSRIRMSVRDYGPHISTSNWKRLRAAIGAPQPLASRPESSGLGLYLSHQFADSMNGSIGVIRHRDGMSFYVDIAASTQLSLL